MKSDANAIKISWKFLLHFPHYLRTFHDTKPHSDKVVVKFSAC